MAINGQFCAFYLQLESVGPLLVSVVLESDLLFDTSLHQVLRHVRSQSLQMQIQVMTGHCLCSTHIWDLGDYHPMS